MTTLYADAELTYDAIRYLRSIKKYLELLRDTSDKFAYGFMAIHETIVDSIIADLNKVISDASAVYAEHADLCKLVKHLNRAVRHYEVED